MIVGLVQDTEQEQSGMYEWEQLRPILRGLQTFHILLKQTFSLRSINGVMSKYLGGESNAALPEFKSELRLSLQSATVVQAPLY